MLLLFILSTALLLVAGVSKAAVDIMSHQPDNNIFMNWGPWYDNRASWKRKYKNYDAGDLRPRFPGATGVLVAFTDFWHLCDFVYLKAYAGAAGLAGVWLYRTGGKWWAVLVALVYFAAILGAVFELTYRRYFRVNRAVPV